MSVSKIVAAAASGFGSDPLDVDDVFSTHLVTGTGSAYTVNNGIDLSGEGGLVWLKNRSSSGYNHTLYDTERSGTLFSDATNAASDYASEIASYNSNGFTTVSSGATYNNVNNIDYVSWTFRKAPKFFDIVTYSGTGSAQNINHSLGQSPGMIIIKSTTNSENWQVWHRSVTGNLELDNTGAINSSSIRITAVSSTNFTLGTFNTSNGSGQTYVAYLFAHNDSGDGEFGPDSDQDIIKCGIYTGNGSSQVINLGFEAQFVFYKAVADLPSYGGENWNILDTMRGMPTGGEAAQYLIANTNAAETGFNSSYGARAHASGFEIFGGSFGSNYNNNNYIYMAIRRGPLAVPEDATKVFGLDATVNSSYPRFTAGFPVDMSIATTTDSGDPNEVASRLTGGVYMRSNSSTYESSSTNYVWDNMTGAYFNSKTNGVAWMWKRAPGYFDVVCYTGNYTDGRTVNHSLGVVPEMIWVKLRNTYNGEWMVFHKDLATNHNLILESVGGSGDYSGRVRTPTATTFTVSNDTSVNRAAPLKYVAYLFATVAGVSKVGSYTGNGSSQNIDCGFSSGARFVLTKCSSHSGAWHVFDTARGIVSGNDPLLELDSTSAQSTSYDAVDPFSSGFTVSDNITNENGRTFIFYAIA